jgi:hypothetical protein
VLPCEYCGKLVWKYKSHMISKVFCNCDCANAYKIAAPPKTISQPCVYCGNIVTKKPSEFYKRYTKLPKNNFAHENVAENKRFGMKKSNLNY